MNRKLHGLVPVMLVASLLVVLGLVGCGGSASGTITEGGSTSVQPLADSLAAAFHTANPDVTVSINGGGTAVGITSCNDGTVDIGAASRELTSSDPALVTHLLARDAIAVIVHPSNPLTGLTKQQVIGIFSGNITNWSQVGGSDGTIHVVAREEGSGTRTAFQDMVMGKDAAGNAIAITSSAILQTSNGALRLAVSGDAKAIGFLSLGQLDSSVKGLSLDGVAPTVANAMSGTYKVVRPLYFLTKSAPTGLVKDFIDYCQSSKGQDIAEQEGFLRIDE